MSENHFIEPENLNDVVHVFRKSIFEHFSEVKDPRVATKRVKHQFLNILFMTLCAVLCGANNLKEVHTFVKVKSREKWFKSILQLPNGIPCYVTFWWVFVLLDPYEFQKGFVSWMNILVKTTGGKLRAIDGKALRGTAQKGDANSFIHMVSMWACEAGVTLGQVQVDEKSNEITAIPKLLEMIDVKGSIITIDAMGTQTSIAKQIIKKEGDYVLALKGNHSNMHDELQNFFEQAEAINFEGIEHTSYHTTEKAHGRIEKRQVYATSDLDWLPMKEEWAGLLSIAMVVSEQTRDGKVSIERRMYITSLPPNAKDIAYAIRAHWGIENQCHWTLDIAFKEDELKARAGNIAGNLSAIRKIALALLKQDKTTKGGVELRRKKAGWDDEYLLQLMGIKSF